MRTVAGRLLFAAIGPLAMAACSSIFWPASAAAEPYRATDTVLGAPKSAKFHPRQAVAEIAALIEANFYDADRARKIAHSLRNSAKAGAYDSFKDPRELAAALSTRLEVEDRHFQVTWPTRSHQGQPDAVREALSGNHGFVEARILAGGVGYIKMDRFAHFDGPNSPQQAAADAALNFVAHQPSLILDLRDNGGGSPNMVGYLVQQFVDNPRAVANIFKSRNLPDSMEISPVPNRLPARTQAPLYILVSARTGSSAEAFAYTLQAAGRAHIVGERTGGAANPGSVQRTASGLEIFISFGTPINPITKANWEKTGVTPDTWIKQADALHWAHLHALETEAPQRHSTPGKVLETLRAAASTEYQASGIAGQYGHIAVSEQNGQLHLQIGRRPELHLIPLGNDHFAAAQDPSARFRIERNQFGEVDALVRILDGNRETRFRKLPLVTANLP